MPLFLPFLKLSSLNLKDDFIERTVLARTDGGTKCYHSSFFSLPGPRMMHYKDLQGHHIGYP